MLMLLLMLLMLLLLMLLLPFILLLLLMLPILPMLSVLPVLLVHLALEALRPLLFGLVWIAAATLVLLYALGRGSLGAEAERYRSQCRRGDFQAALQIPDLELILELTGDSDILAEIYHKTHHGVRVIDHVSAQVFWDLIRLEADIVLEADRQWRLLRANWRQVSKQQRHHQRSARGRGAQPTKDFFGFETQRAGLARRTAHDAAFEPDRIGRHPARRHVLGKRGQVDQ